MSDDNNLLNKSKIEIKDIKLDEKREDLEEELRKKYGKEDIDNFFSVINENKISGWDNKLKESKLSFRDFSQVNDADILSEEFNDSKTSRIIKGDIYRTRVKESIYMDNFKDYVYQLIIYYLNKNNISYKQGLNEIAGSFILLKYKISVSFAKLYTMFVCFIDKFLTNYYLESEFYSLQSSLSLINLLLRYHDPELYHRFEFSMITPDLYSTSWILTLFANKCTLNVIYHLWDKLILFDDNLFPHFFITAYLIKNKKKFFEVECTIILSVLSKLRIDNIEEVNEILDFATEIRDNTPNSFYLLANKLEIFKYGSTNLKKLYEEYKPDKMLALPMFETDLFTITYKDLISCPDENCENFLLKNKKFNYNSKCMFCRNKQVKPELFYIIFDLRIFDNDDDEEKEKKGKGLTKIFSPTYPGFLPKTITITNKELEDENFPRNILEEYQSEKEKNHFIIITSETNYFNEYEKEFYKDRDRRNSKVGVFYKNYKELDTEKANELSKKKRKAKKYTLLKEFDKFKILIDEMTEEGFKNVSFVYGGYKNVHSYAMKYNIELLEHREKCILCNEDKYGILSKISGFFK